MKKGNIKKYGLSLVCASIFAVSGFAGVSFACSDSTGGTVTSDFDLKINGFAHFQSGYRNQSKLQSDEKNVSANRRSFAFYNDTSLMINGTKTMCDLEYGAKIVLVPTAKKRGAPSVNGSHIFLQTEYGKVELGSPVSAGTNMFIDGTDIVAGTGDNWDRYADIETKHLKQFSATANKTVNGITFGPEGNQSAPTFVNFSEFFLDSKLQTRLDNRKFSNEPSRAVSYYTPKFEIGSSSKIQAGITYIPDSSNTGADNPTAISSGQTLVTLTSGGKEAFKIDSSVKDAFTGGLVVEHNFMDGVDLKLSFTGEVGKSAGGITRVSEDTTLNDKKYKLSNLKTYNVGGVLNYGNFSVAGSYGSLGKSLTSSEYHKTGRNTNYYTAAVAYKYGPFDTSLSYIKTNAYKNTVDSVALGTSYKLAPGLKPYVEIATFSLKGKPEFLPELSKRKTNGIVGIVGLKLSM